MVKTRGGHSQFAKRGSSSQETESPSKQEKTSSASLEPPSPQKPEVSLLSALGDKTSDSEKPAPVVKSTHSSLKKTSPKSKVPKLCCDRFGKTRRSPTCFNTYEKEKSLTGSTKGWKEEEICHD